MLRILTATGGSRHAERALRLSCRLVRNQAAELTALTVEDSEEPTSLEHAQNRARTIAQKTNTVITLEHASGHPDQVIRETALQHFDLLVIGARGMHSIQDFFLGRNAIRIVKNLPVSTLVVRRHDTAGNVLWRVPRGPVDEKQVALMCHVVKSLQANLTLLLVQPSAHLFGYRQNVSRCTAEPCAPDQWLDPLCSRIKEATGKQVACRLRTGVPEEVIMDEAAIGNYDLVAISVQPRHGLGKLFAENLSYRVARNIPVSVLLLS